MKFNEFDLFNPTEEHSMLRQTVGNFVKNEVEPQAMEHDREEKFNLPLFRKLGDLGLLGITVPEEFGGAGMDALAAVITHEELAYSDAGFCLAYLAHSMLCVNNLAVNANEEQKKRFLPGLCSGELIGALGMSEPDGGTDVLGMRTEAKSSKDGFSIQGRKMWITNGVVGEMSDTCDCLLLYAKTGETEKGRAEISSFILEKGMPGFSVGQKLKDKTGMRASSTAELVFDDCKVPQANLVGEPGNSLLHMMRNLELERLALAAMGIGIAKRCLDVMVSYSKERKAFGKEIYRFGQIQRHIADSYAEYSAARCYVYETARRLDLQKANNRLDSDGVKLVSAPMAKNVADRAMQVLGGYGYVAEYTVERMWRDAKLLEIGGGTLESHQKNITFDLVEKMGSVGKS